MQRALRSSVYWFAPHDLLSLLSYRSGANSPGMASPAMVWALSCLSLIKKMSYLLEYSPSYGGGFFFSIEVHSSQTIIDCVKLM